VRPALRFTQVKAAGGIVMLLAAIVALVWANSPWDGGYRTFLSTPLDFRFGTFVKLEFTLRGVVNDALMTLFFLLAGLEIKREVVIGELRDRRAAALPALAALGGMVVPALLFGVGRLPTSTTWRHMFGLAVTAGIGFTVALFVTGLSYRDESLTSSAKLGVIAASVIAGVAGYLLLRTAPTPANVEVSPPP
jgi:NhaA family Na+:H+ antiporter